MFWGLIMEPQRRYTQTVKKAFHISMAALDMSTSANDPSQIMLGFEGRNYLLCTLQKPNNVQCALDLNFEVGSEISFAANGKSHVHLTGYLTEEFLDEELAEEAEESSEEEEQVEESTKGKKRVNQSLENGQPKKKSKVGLVSSSQVEEEEESDDSDFNGSTVEEEEDNDEDEASDDEQGEDEEDDDDDEDAGEEDEEDSSLSEDEEEVAVIKKEKLNGIAKKNEKDDKKVQKQKSQQKGEEKAGSNKRTLQKGLIVEDLKEGQGQPAKNGKFVTVYYEGRLKSNNKMFDSTTKGAGFRFRLGNGEVIKGWDIGVAGMKPGGKRRITCPPIMAYGPKGSPPTIPPNSTLVFDVELKKIS